MFPTTELATSVRSNPCHPLLQRQLHLLLHLALAPPCLPPQKHLYLLYSAVNKLHPRFGCICYIWPLTLHSRGSCICYTQPDTLHPRGGWILLQLAPTRPTPEMVPVPACSLSICSGRSHSRGLGEGRGSALSEMIHHVPSCAGGFVVGFLPKANYNPEHPSSL